MLPAGLGIVCAQPEGARRSTTQAKLPRVLLRLRRHEEGQRDRLLPLHAVAAACSTGCASRSTCCSRRGWRTSSPGTTGWPRAPGAAVKAWGLELCARAAQVVLGHGQRHHGAGRHQRRRGDRRRLPPLQPGARRRPRADGGQAVPHRPPGRPQRAACCSAASPAPRWRCATSGIKVDAGQRGRPRREEYWRSTGQAAREARAAAARARCRSRRRRRKEKATAGAAR